MESRTVTDLPIIEKTVGPAWNGTEGTGNFDTSRSPIDRIYIHTIVGTLASADARFNNPKSNASAHYGIGLDGAVWHWVDEDKTAYHCGVYKENQRSIGIEHEDNGESQDSVRTDAEYMASAKLVANICKFYGIPCDRTHIKRHSEAPYNTQCCGGLDIERIVREAKAILDTNATPPPADPVQPPPSPATPAPVAPVNNQPNIYKGIDLNNQESVKAAVDTWEEVASGNKYITKAGHEAFAAQICQGLGIENTSDITRILETVKTLKEDFKQKVVVATGIPADAQIEGAGTPVTPAVQPGKPITLKDLPDDEVEKLAEALHGLFVDVVSEVKKHFR